MSLDPRTSLFTLSASSATSTPASTRVSLKPGGVPSGQVDGAWWPRSSDLPAELPALSTELRDRCNVERISYNLGSWPKAPRRLLIEHHTVRLSGYRTNSVHTIELRTGRGEATTLLMIPVDSSPEFAEAAMLTAAQPGGRDSIEDIFGNARIAAAESEARK